MERARDRLSPRVLPLPVNLGPVLHLLRLGFLLAGEENSACALGRPED